MSGSPGSELLSTKLAAPAPRPGLIPQTDLQARLQTALEAKLCLLDAPAGSGKTTLLAQWCATAGAGRVAWVSLDEGDNDPTRFWVYVAEALRTVEPNLGAGVLDALRRPSADLHRTVLPSLLNELGEAGSPLFLVLDDYHLITNPACHQSVGYFLDHLPAGVHVALAGRTDPPLPMPRMRVSGHMAELRVADLQFTGEEAAALLNGAMGLRLAPDDVERLAERTEGWAAGLYLAGAVASRPAGPERLRRRLPGRQPPHRRLPGDRGARPANRTPSGRSCCAPRSWSACPARCATPSWRHRDRRGCWRSWNAPTCSWCRSTTVASGTATTTCSGSCCAWSSPPVSQR